MRHDLIKLIFLLGMGSWEGQASIQGIMKEGHQESFRIPARPAANTLPEMGRKCENEGH